MQRSQRKLADIPWTWQSARCVTGIDPMCRDGDELTLVAANGPRLSALSTVGLPFLAGENSKLWIFTRHNQRNQIWREFGGEMVPSGDLQRCLAPIAAGETRFVCNSPYRIM